MLRLLRGGKLIYTRAGSLHKCAHVQSARNVFTERIYMDDTAQLRQEAASAYRKHFERVIKLEYENEVEMIERRLATETDTLLAGCGVALFDLYAQPKGTLYKERIIRFHHGLKKALPFHQFNSGDCVKITNSRNVPHGTSRATLFRDSINGTVLSRTNLYLDVCVSDFAHTKTAWDGPGLFRLDSDVDKLSYQRMREALDLFVKPVQQSEDALAFRELILRSFPIFLKQIEAETKMLNTKKSSEYPYMSAKPGPMGSIRINEDRAIDATDRKELLSTLDLGHEESNIEYTEKQIDKAFSELYVRLRKMGAPVHANLLNKSQEGAIKGAIIAPRVALIQGPPGTGKTKTAVSLLAILAILQKNKIVASLTNTSRKNRKTKQLEDCDGTRNGIMIACAQSNVAADNLLEGLIRSGVNAIRVGKPTRVNSNLWEHTVNAQVYANKDYRRFRKKAAIATLRWQFVKANPPRKKSQLRRGRYRYDETEFLHMVKMRKKLSAVEEEYTIETLSSVDVIVMTCSGAGSELIKRFLAQRKCGFPTVLVDEAAQCSELSLLPALVHGCEKLILVGDHNQLPPMVASPIVQREGLVTSLFSRLVDAGVHPWLLNEQFRMHPDIAVFSTVVFYDGMVHSSLSVEKMALVNPPQGFAWPNPRIPVAFIDISPWSTHPKPSNSSDSVTEVVSSHVFTEADDELPINPALFYDGVPMGQGYERILHALYPSFSNTKEAEAVERVVFGLLGTGETLIGDIGVISPYSAQVKDLTERFQVHLGDSIAYNSKLDGEVDSDLDDDYDSDSGSDSGSDSDSDSETDCDDLDTTSSCQDSVDSYCSDSDINDFDSNHDVEGEPFSEETTSCEATNSRTVEKAGQRLEINSIDGFQGREKEVIIISAVRSNSKGEVGFLQDWRRLNVGLTRAKRGLIVIGDSSTLRHDPYWNQLIKHCKTNGCFKVEYYGEK